MSGEASEGGSDEKWRELWPAWAAARQKEDEDLLLHNVKRDYARATSDEQRERLTEFYGTKLAQVKNTYQPDLLDVPDITQVVADIIKAVAKARSEGPASSFSLNQRVTVKMSRVACFALITQNIDLAKELGCENMAVETPLIQQRDTVNITAGHARLKIVSAPAKVNTPAAQDTYRYLRERKLPAGAAADTAIEITQTSP